MDTGRVLMDGGALMDTGPVETHDPIKGLLGAVALYPPPPTPPATTAESVVASADLAAIRRKYSSSMIFVFPAFIHTS